MSLRDRATAGVAWSALHTWGTHALQLGVMLVLARLLEPRDFGLFAMAQVALVLIHAFVDQGIPEALVQSNRTDRAYWSTGFLAVLASSAAGAALLFLLGGAIAGLFRTPALEPVLRWLAPGVVLYGVHAVYYARIRAGLVFAAHAVAGVAGAVAAFAVGVAAAVGGAGVWALVASAYAALIVEAALLIRATGRIPILGFDRAIYTELLRFGRFIVAGALTTVLTRRSDDYFVGLFLGPELLGFYAAAYRLLELVTTVFLRAVERVAFPLLSKLRDSPQLMAEAIHTSFRFTSLVAFPAFAGLAVVAADLVVVALGARWAAAAVPLQILAVGGLALCAVNVFPSAIRAAGFPQWNVAISGGLGILLAGAFAITARWGLAAVAWAFTLGVYAIFPAFFLAVRRVAPLSLRSYLAEGAPPLAASLAMVIVLLAVGPLLGPLSPLARLVAAVTLGAACYAGAALLLAPRHVRDARTRVRQIRSARA